MSHNLDIEPEVDPSSFRMTRRRNRHRGYRRMDDWIMGGIAVNHATDLILPNLGINHQNAIEGSWRNGSYLTL